MRKIKLTVLVSLAFTTGAFSQKDTSKLLDEVTVTATRKAQRDLLVPYSTESVSKAYLQNYQSRSTPEALIGTTGVFVQKTNHGGGSPFIRGLTGNQTLILIDGIRLNNSTFRYGPNQYLNTIDPFTINQIEVAKGTGSVQYGSDAMGGVIQVFTADPKFSTGKPVWSGKAVGKFMTGGMEKTGRGEASYSAGGAAATIGATYKNFGDLIGGDTTGKQSPSGYEEYSFDVKTRFVLRPNIGLTLAHQFLQQQQVPVYHKVQLENFAVNEFDPQRRMLTYAKLSIEGKQPSLNRIDMTASWQQHMEGRNSRKNGTDILRMEKDKVNTIGFTTDINSEFSKSWSANSGIELYYDKVNSGTEDLNIQTGASAKKRRLYPDGSEYGNYSIYSLHHVDLNKWLIEAGVRYNFFQININDTTLGNVKISPSSFVYNASLLYKITISQSVYASFNTGYRAPNVDDMGTLGIVDFRYEVPAYDLEPERSRTIELGYKLEAGKWAASLSGYYMHLNNLITRVKSDTEVINGYPVYKKENVEEAYIEGLEAELAYELMTGWNISGNISLTKGQSLTRSEPLRRIPPVNGRLLSTYQYKKWFGSAEFLIAAEQTRLAQGDKEDNRIPRGGTPGWNVFNLYGGYQFGALKLNLAFLNILNQDYRTHGSGINGVGRSVSLAATVVL
ncbi:TonB-dependent receptor plug domain-containing protein [Flavitalea sp.]|nr:TonB-dependent receptor [Flavitalea sp.]